MEDGRAGGARRVNRNNQELYDDGGDGLSHYLDPKNFPPESFALTPRDVVQFPVDYIHPKHMCSVSQTLTCVPLTKRMRGGEMEFVFVDLCDAISSHLNAAMNLFKLINEFHCLNGYVVEVPGRTQLSVSSSLGGKSGQGGKNPVIVGIQECFEFDDDGSGDGIAERDLEVDRDDEGEGE